MKILNLLAACGTGGIEVLLRDIILDSTVDNRICCLFEEGEIYEELKTRTNKIFSLKNKNRNIKKIIQELSEYCIKEKIDIIVVHHGGIKCNLIYVGLKKKLPKIKYVRYFHSSFDEYWEGRDNKIKDIVLKMVMQKSIDKSDLLVFISNAVKDTFRRNFKIDNKKCEIVYNGINKKFFIKDRKENEKERNTLIYIGRLEELKGVDILIKSLKNICEQEVIKLTIVGEGSKRKELEELAEKIGLSRSATKKSENDLEEKILESTISFVGRQNDVIQWLDKSDIFIYPSRCEEGFGISVVEAMARGCIPITFKKGGLPEIIENGENGYLIDKIDSKELAEKILEVVKIKNKDQIRKNAIDTAKKFTVENTIKSLEQLYKKL